MKISKRIELDYGHTLPNHYSFCNQIHGHGAFVVAEVEGDVNKSKGTSGQGMVLDFKFLKEIMMTEIHGKLDHGFAVWDNDVEDKEFIIRRNKKYIITSEPPTAECLAKWAFNLIYPLIPKGIRLCKVTWFETPNSSAEYDLNNYNNENNNI